MREKEEYFVIYFTDGGYASSMGRYEAPDLSSLGEISRVELKVVGEDGFKKVLKTWYFPVSK